VPCRGIRINAFREEEGKRCDLCINANRGTWWPSAKSMTEMSMCLKVPRSLTRVRFGEHVGSSAIAKSVAR